MSKIDVNTWAKKEYGINDAQSFVDNYRMLYAKYEKLVKPIENDQQKVTDLLWNEVMSKIDVNTWGMKK